MRYASIGGQAVIEGVMMRFGDEYAVAVRKPDKEIEVKRAPYKSLVSRLHVGQIPILRGMFSFLDSMILGISTLTYSASFYDDEEEEGSEKAQSGDKKEKDQKADSSFGLVMALTVVIAIAIAVFLFMLTPYFISTLFGRLIKSSVLLAVIEGIVRLAVFLLYMIAISRTESMQRVFMYHGAEHKTISCIEHGMELTPESAMKCSRLHKRCGTSFLLFVMLVSIVCFMFIRTDSHAMRIVLRLVLVPVIADISYEFIRLAERTDSTASDILSAPGLMLQKYFTTREPDLDMLEVAIASIEAIYDWRGFQKGREGL